MSPIASLRKANYNSTLGSIGSETVDMSKFPPSFRITRNYGTTNNRSNLRYRHRGEFGFFVYLHLLKVIVMEWNLLMVDHSRLNSLEQVCILLRNHSAKLEV